MQETEFHSLSKQLPLVFRIGKQTLSFAVNDLQTEHRILFEPYTVRSGISMAANLREAFKENGLLLRKFQKAQVFVDAPVVMVPVEEFVEEEAEKMYKYVLTECDNIETLHYIMPETNAVALFGISKDLKMVLTDNIPNVRFMPIMQPVWKYMHRRSFSGHHQKLYACFHDKKVDVFCFNKNRFKFTNSFDVSHPHDAVYYIMHVWKLLGFDATNDELFIMGNIPEYEWHIENLNRYINKVYTINPTAEFNRAPATQVKGMPFDLITLFTKG